MVSPVSPGTQASQPVLSPLLPKMNNNTAEKQQVIPAVTKPKPALTAYNLFFQVERKRILDGTDSLGMPIFNQDLKIAVWAHKAKTGKRLHRKTHGKIGFKELAYVVANRWKKLDPKTRKMLEDHAQKEKQEYEILLEEWKKKSEEFEHDTTCKIEQDSTSSHGMFFNAKQQQPVRLQSSSSSVCLSNVDDKPKSIGRINDFEMLQSIWKQLVSDSSVDCPIGDEPLQDVSGMHNCFSHPRREGPMNFLGNLKESAQQAPQHYPNSVCVSDESCYLFSSSDNMLNGLSMQCPPTNIHWVQQEQTAQHMVLPLDAHILEPTPILETGTVACAAYLNCLPFTGSEPPMRNTFPGHWTNTGFEPRESSGFQGQGSISVEQKHHSSSFPILPDLHGASLAPEDRNQWDEICYLASLVEPF